MSDLREKLARALCTDEGNPCGCVTACKIGLHYADIALPIALEEAAKVCDDIESLKWKLWLEHYDMLDKGASDGAGDCAAAIRELINGKKV